MQSHGQLKSVSNIWSRATLEEHATCDGSNSTSSVGSDVANYGPKSGIASDLSRIEEHVRDMRAEAMSPSETRFIDIRGQDIISYIYGHNPYQPRFQQSWARPQAMESLRTSITRNHSPRAPTGSGH